MKSKIKEALKTKYTNLGLSDEILEGVANLLAISVKEETEIATAVTGAEVLLKASQRYADSRVNSVKTEAETYKAKLEELEKKGKGEESKPEKTDETPAWAKAIMDSTAKLEQELSSLKGEKTHESLNAKLLSTLSEKKVPESFYTPAIFGRTFSKEDEVTAIAETISTSYQKYAQDMANASGGFQPEGGSAGAAGDEAKAIAGMIEKGTKEIINNKK